jgi:hypothetical protein
MNEPVKKVIIDGIEYTITEDEKWTHLRTTQKNEDGFIVNISFTKDDKEDQEAYEAVKEFFIREILCK